jgi:hypothetical protein
LKAGKAKLDTVPRPYVFGAAALAVALASLGAGPDRGRAACHLEVPLHHTTTLTQDAAYCCLEVYGMLNINAGVTLTLNGDGCATSTVDGTVNLQGARSVLRFHKTSHNLTGDGSIVGKSNTAGIDICSAITVTSSVDVVGALQIRADNGASSGGEFKVGASGVVNADGSQTDKNLVLYDGKFSGECGGVYQVGGSGATLQFSSGITFTQAGGMFADIIGTAGTLDIDEIVSTYGHFSATEGVTINVDDDMSFTADPNDETYGCCPDDS